MSLLRLLFCRLGFHLRSRRKAVRTETGWRSVCRGCGHPMVRIKGGGWRPMVRATTPTREERAARRRDEARRKRTPPPRRKRKDGR